VSRLIGLTLRSFFCKKVCSCFDVSMISDDTITSLLGVLLAPELLQEVNAKKQINK